MRGRLIQKFVCVLRRLDTTATAAVSGGGYDEEFGEVINVNNGTEFGVSSRVESEQIRLHCQLDRDPDFNSTSMTRGGQQDKGRIVIILFMEDLEEKEMLDEDGKPLIFPGDRIEAIETVKGNHVLSFKDPKLFVNSVQLQGYGLSALREPKINLVELVCSPEMKSREM